MGGGGGGEGGGGGGGGAGEGGGLDGGVGVLGGGGGGGGGERGAWDGWSPSECLWIGCGSVGVARDHHSSSNRMRPSWQSTLHRGDRPS